MIRLSIIIPVYNSEKYLSRCLDSILIQDCKNVEILLINDGSTDRSKNVCEEYTRKYSNIKLYNQTNSGPSVARNKGISHAIGTYISFVDSDDYVSDNYIQFLVNSIEKFKYPDIIAFNHVKVGIEEINVTNGLSSNRVYEHEDIVELIKNTSQNPFLLYVSMRFIKLDLIKNNNILFDEDIKMGEDTIFNLESFYSAKKIISVDKYLYNYIANPESITNTKYKPFLIDSMQAHFENRLDFHNKHQNIKSVAHYKDIAVYYIEHILFLLLNNAKNNIDINFVEELRNIRELSIFDFGFKYYSSTGRKTIKMKLIILLFKYRIYNLIDAIYK